MKRVLFLLYWISGIIGSSELEAPRFKRKSEYITSYACESRHLNISCPESSYLDIIRANYGRFSITVCNEGGITDWSVNCLSPRTLRVVKARCGNKRACEVPVDSAIFGDPCPGTFKYIEVQYQCTKEPTSLTSTPKPRPSWFPLSSPDSWSTINNHLSGITETHLPSSDSTTQGPPQVNVPEAAVDFTTARTTLSESATTPTVSPDVSTTIKTTQRPIKNKFTDDMKVVPNFTRFCPPTHARGLFWNWTSAGETSVIQCPPGSTGFAKWYCESRPPSVGWASPTPSLAECKSLWSGDLDSQLRQGASVVKIGNDLSEFSGLGSMFGPDILLSSKMLKHMAERTQFDLQKTLDPRDKEALVTQLIQSVVKTGSNILDYKNLQSWRDLDKEDVERSISALMMGIEDNAFLLANAVTSEKIIIKPTRHLLLSIRVMQSRNALHQRFPSVETVEADTIGAQLGNSIDLSSDSLIQNGLQNGAVRVIFAMYDGIERVLRPSLDSDRGYRFLNSRVLSASLGKTGGSRSSVPLSTPVYITFKHLRLVNVSEPECVFWDYNHNSWKGDGCQVSRTNDSHTICNCDHLTHFGLFMRDDDLSGRLPNLKKVHHRSKGGFHTNLTVIIAAAISSFSVLFLVLIAVLIWRKYAVSTQCRSALENSGLPCFHKKGKQDPEADKARDRGNFYTVNPKLNNTAAGLNQGSGAAAAGDNKEDDAQIFFEHMIAMQKNPPATNKRNSSSGLRGKGDFQDMEELNVVKGQHEQTLTKKSSNYRAKSPFNHIYMEIDDNPAQAQQQPVQQQQIVYEPLSETYMMSTISDLSEDVSTHAASRQSSSRECRPLIRRGNHLNQERNLLTTISGVLQSQSVRLPHNNSIGSSGGNPARRSMFTRHPPQSECSEGEVPVQVTTLNGSQFLCLNINNNTEGNVNGVSCNTLGRPGVVQPPAHSQQIRHGMATLPRMQYAHPLSDS